MRKTRPQLETELIKAKEELRRTEDTLFAVADRNKIAGYYIQVLRVMFDKIGGHIQAIDFDRLSDILERDRYPEGF